MNEPQKLMRGLYWRFMARPTICECGGVVRSGQHLIALSTEQRSVIWDRYFPLSRALCVPCARNRISKALLGVADQLDMMINGEDVGQTEEKSPEIEKLFQIGADALEEVVEQTSSMLGRLQDCVTEFSVPPPTEEDV